MDSAPVSRPSAPPPARLTAAAVRKALRGQGALGLVISVSVNGSSLTVMVADGRARRGDPAHLPEAAQAVAAIPGVLQARSHLVGDVAWVAAQLL